jgi:hypothetical protein
MELKLSGKVVSCSKFRLRIYKCAVCGSNIELFGEGSVSPCTACGALAPITEPISDELLCTVKTTEAYTPS